MTLVDRLARTAVVGEAERLRESPRPWGERIVWDGQTVCLYIFFRRSPPLRGGEGATG